ncbi:MAG: excinuclease ABC subunit UvrC [Clostridia bacterium]|nr:excinuclease ABC subunit UvrC [Clostridia bacterium]
MNLHDKARSLPELPGVYIMKNKVGEIIYVGKAKKLINRVSSYFAPNPNHNYKTSVMVSKVHSFDYIVTDTEFEALVLENSLIKRHKPRYNILLKDDKGYPFIRLDIKAEYPRFSIVSKISDDGARYFGPYGGRNVSRTLLDAVCSTLKLPTCKRAFPQTIGKGRPCLSAHLKKCDAVCSGKVTREEYLEKIRRAIDLFEGKSDDLIAKLQTKMTECAERMEFETAAKIRDEIRAIENLGARQKIISGTLSDTDVIAFAAGESKCAFSVLCYVGGMLLDSEVFLVETPVYLDKSELLSDFVKGYYMQKSAYPKTVCIASEISDSELLAQWLTHEATRRVEVIYPKRGDKVKLCKMAQKNAEEKLKIAVSDEEKTVRVMEDLRRLLGLATAPHRIECYDISNTNGADQVASMVVFEDGKPKRSAYRKFKIKSLADQNDVAAHREVISRRMERFKSGDEKFTPLPDIIFLDGGKPQVSGVVAMNIGVPVFGLVKDDRHRTRGIINEKGEEVSLASSPALFALCGRIQEEVHRVAISYHRKLRDKTGSSLTKIPGVGEVMAKKLLHHFKSIKAIKSADLETLSKVVTRDTAQNILDYFKER